MAAGSSSSSAGGTTTTTTTAAGTPKHSVPFKGTNTSITDTSTYDLRNQVAAFKGPDTSAKIPPAGRDAFFTQDGHYAGGSVADAGEELGMANSSRADSKHRKR